MRKEKKINYHDTDAVGIAYYGAYLSFLEESRTRFLEERGVLVKDMHENGKYFVVKSFKADYKKPVHYGDVITCNTKVSKVTAARICFLQTILNKKSKEVLVRTETVLVIVGKSLKPILIPEKVSSALHEEMEV